MKKDIGFRFSEETHSQLLDLSGRWGCTRTEVIEALVREAVRAVEAEQPPSVQISEHPAEPKILPKDPKEVAKLAAAISKDVRKVTDTRSQQEKLDDFYRSNMAKGKK